MVSKKKKKKKKKVCTEIESDFWAKIENSNDFSAQKQVVSKKKKTKNRWSPDHDIYFTTSAPNFLWGGGCFQFFTQNRPKKQRKRAILHTSQARAPPGYATASKRRWPYPLDESSPAYELTVFQVFLMAFDFFPRKFAACSEPPSRDNHRKAPFPKTQKSDYMQGEPRSSDQDRRENDTFSLSATLLPKYKFSFKSKPSEKSANVALPPNNNPGSMKFGFTTEIIN